MNAAKKVIIDCDPGIDDALALMLRSRRRNWKSWHHGRLR